MSLSSRILESLNKVPVNENDVVIGHIDLLQKELSNMKSNWSNGSYYKSIRNFYGSVKSIVDALDKELSRIIDRAKENK